jgi:hypothetical protein
MPRAGTTVLYRTLLRHTSFKPHSESCNDFIDETHVFIQPEMLFTLNSETHPRLRKFLCDDRDTITKLAAALAECRTSEPHNSAHPYSYQEVRRGNWQEDINEWTARGFDQAIRLMFHFAKRVRGVRRVVEKTPDHIRRLPEIVHTFPAAKIIAHLRHPVDVLSSYRKRLHAERRIGTPETEIAWLEAPVAHFAERFRFVVGKAAAVCQKSPTLATLSTHEDLVADPQTTLRRLCAFLGEPFETRIIATDSSSASSTATSRTNHDLYGPYQGPLRSFTKSWADYLDVADARRLEDELEPEMEQLGYERYT